MMKILAFQQVMLSDGPLGEDTQIRKTVYDREDFFPADKDFVAQRGQIILFSMLNLYQINYAYLQFYFPIVR
ncbi:MAG: hypothetical protein HRU41_11710 [Saprospiraceae bacterium]|nr:hypothetical protein [Saprospiraceae bacterium]